jgi:chemotaxis protein MotB
MAEEGKDGQVIVIKKKNRGGHGGHHGGAWKVAYADFVTAMMAFFLLLWLLSSTTEEQKMGIAYYFNPPNNATQSGGGAGIMGGQSAVNTEGQAPFDAPSIPPQAVNNEDLAVMAKDDALFRQVAEELKKAVMNIPQLKSLLDNLQVDITPEGLRITLRDSEGRALFADGRAEMLPHTQQLLTLVAAVVQPMPNQLAIGGHTDVAPFAEGTGRVGDNDAAYSNWELSADRAQAARRLLVREGVPERRIDRVAGFAGQTPLLPDAPADVRNRRITVVVLRSKRATLARFSDEGLIVPTGPEVR